MPQPALLHLGAKRDQFLARMVEFDLDRHRIALAENRMVRVEFPQFEERRGDGEAFAGGENPRGVFRRAAAARAASASRTSSSTRKTRRGVAGSCIRGGHGG